MAGSDNINIRLRLLGASVFRRDASKAADSLGRIGRAGALAASTTGVAVAAAGVAAVNMAANFEQQISRLGAVSGASASQMDKLRDAALKAGSETAYTATEAALAQTELAKGGISARDILSGGLNAALSLAAAGEVQLGDAATYTANALNLFGLRGKSAGHIADALATAANATTADVADFGMALTQGGAVAKQVGYSFDQTVLALEALAKAGIKNSDAGTSLKTALIHLVKPVGEGAKAIEKYHLNFKTANGEMKSFQGISVELRKKLGGMTKTQRLATLAAVAGTDGVRTLAALYDAGPRRLNRYAAALRKQGTAAEVALKKQDNLKGQIEKLKGALQTLGIAIGSFALRPLTSLARHMTGVVNAISGAVPKIQKKISSLHIPDKAREVLAGITSGKAAGGTRLVTERDSGTGTRLRLQHTDASESQKVGAKIRQVFDQVAATAKKYGPVVLAYGRQLVDAFKPALPFFENVLKPLFIGIAQGIAGTILTALKFLPPVIKVAATALGFLGNALRPLRPLIHAVGLAIGFLVGPGVVKALAIGLGRLAMGFRIVSVPVRLLLFPFRALGRMFPMISQGARMALASIEVALRGIPGRIGGVVGAARGAAGRLAGAIGRAIMSVVSRVPGRVGTALGRIAGTLGRLVTSLGRAAGRIGRAIVTGIVNAIKAAPGAILSAIESIVPDGLKGAVNSVVGTVGGAVTSLIPGRAGGGFIDTPYTLVGEKGPEIIAGGQGRRVHTAQETRSILAPRRSAPAVAAAQRPIIIRPAPVYIGARKLAEILFEHEAHAESLA